MALPVGVKQIVFRGPADSERHDLRRVAEEMSFRVSLP